MKKIQEFLKSNELIVKWTIGYFFVLWLILKFVFNFDMFSAHYWWKFFHATLHGFSGFVFGILVYSAIPIYIATTLVIHRKQEPIITIPFLTKIKDFVSSIFTKIFTQKSKKTEKQSETIEPEKSKVQDSDNPEQEFPDNLPSELRVPFMRAKNHIPLTGAISIYNKPHETPQQTTPEQIMDTSPNIPIPTDFDISENFNNNVPTFTDINFDEPKKNESVFQNNTTKYFESKNIEFETYKNFVATEKYLIYEHSDGDFWIMDDNTWFAAGQQIESPEQELIEIAKQNNLTPVIYLQSQNIMDIEETTKRFESNGIKVIKSLEELD